MESRDLSRRQNNGKFLAFLSKIIAKTWERHARPEEENGSKSWRQSVHALGLPTDLNNRSQGNWRFFIECISLRNVTFIVILKKNCDLETLLLSFLWSFWHNSFLTDKDIMTVLRGEPTLFQPAINLSNWLRKQRRKQQNRKQRS